MIRVFKRNPIEGVIIIECALLVHILIALLWGSKNEVSRIPIARAGNLNVFHWLQNWEAKSGTSRRMPQTLVGNLVENKVEIIPRYVRVGRNFPRDYLSRTDEEGIRHCASCNHMKRVSLPTFRDAFCERWKPEADFGPNGAMRIRFLSYEHGEVGGRDLVL